MRFMSQIVCCVFLFSVSQAVFALSLLEGKWNVTDSMGNARFVVDVYETSTGSLSAKVIKNKSAQARCVRCKSTRRNKPIKNMVILSGLMQVPGNPREYNHGKLLDVVSGRMNPVIVKINHGNLHILGTKNKRINQLWTPAE